jgi:protein-S-isoprenylcysteine O-methyltransferase Ste14
VLQGVLLLLVLVAGLLGARWPEPWRPWLLAAAVVVGATALPLGFGGIHRLGEQLTPFPRPVAGAEVKRSGAYAFVRHPIYGGVLLLSLAWSLGTSPLAPVGTAALGLLFECKRRREEAWLLESSPEYQDYMRRVRRRFIPFVW